MYDFFELMAMELVEDPADAEVIVSNKNISCAEGQECIRSYDVERIIALMNSNNT